MRGEKVEIPIGAPKSGEVYRHFKGDLYQVLALALHSNDAEWMVVYEPLYENPDAPMFVRPLREWRDDKQDYEGKPVARFTLALPH
jgi:hypothetical protein